MSDAPPDIVVVECPWCEWWRVTDDIGRQDTYEEFEDHVERLHYAQVLRESETQDNSESDG